MPRKNNKIWILCNDEQIPLKAFTVKRELLSHIRHWNWLYKQSAWRYWIAESKSNKKYIEFFKLDHWLGPNFDWKN